MDAANDKFNVKNAAAKSMKKQTLTMNELKEAIRGAERLKGLEPEIKKANERLERQQSVAKKLSDPEISMGNLQKACASL